MDEATPRGTFRQYVPCIVTAALGVGLSVAAAVTTMGFETRHAESQFQVLAQNHFMIVQNGLDEYVNRLEAVRAFFDSSDVPVSRAAFTSFTRPLLLENAAIATLSWVPRVRNADRAAFEHQAALDGVPGYRIGALGDNGEITPAPEQSEYYPIFYATVPTTSPLYGLDLRSEPRTLVEMESARDDNRLGYSPVPTLVSSGNVKGGFIFSLPVYRRGAPHDSIEDRRLNLIGFVHGSLITSTMIDTIIAANKTPVGLDTYFFEPDSGTDFRAVVCAAFIVTHQPDAGCGP